MLDLVRGYYTTSMALYPDEKRTWQELHHALLLQQMLEHWYFAHYHTEKEVGKIRIMHNDYTMIPHEASVAAEKDMIRRMHRQAEIAEALGLLDDAPNQKNGDDIS